MRRAWLLLAVVAALGGTTSATAGTTSVERQSRTLVLERTTSGPASFRLILDAQLSDEEREGFVGIVSAKVERGELVDAAALAAHAFYWDYGVRAAAGEQVVEVCEPAGGCIVNRTLAYQTITWSEDEGGDDVHNRLYVAVEGPGQIRFSGTGWELRRAPLSYRWLGSADADGLGAHTGVHGVQVFDSAALAGGATGSIAVGAPPCSSSTPGAGPAVVHRGVGTATLTGGARPLSLTCPTNVGRPYLTGVAPGRTDWRLTGPVVGDTTGVNVPLLVVDLPDRL